MSQKKYIKINFLKNGLVTSNKYSNKVPPGGKSASFEIQHGKIGAFLLIEKLVFERKTILVKLI